MKLVGERRALAALVLAFWFINYLLAGIDSGVMFLFALAGVYGLAFVAVVAGYFWARWYAMGVCLFGVIIGAVGLWQTGIEPSNPLVFALMIFGGSHLLATFMLVGSAMSELFDGQKAWRERFHMDDNAVQRLGRSVIRAGVSLPLVLAYSLLPRQGGPAIVAAVLATLGFTALVRLRTWGVLALGAAGALVLVAGGPAMHVHGIAVTLPPSLAGVLLIAAAVPFVRPMLRQLRSV